MQPSATQATRRGATRRAAPSAIRAGAPCRHLRCPDTARASRVRPGTGSTPADAWTRTPGDWPQPTSGWPGDHSGGTGMPCCNIDRSCSTHLGNVTQRPCTAAVPLARGHLSHRTGRHPFPTDRRIARTTADTPAHGSEGAAGGDDTTGQHRIEHGRRSRGGDRRKRCGSGLPASQGDVVLGRARPRRAQRSEATFWRLSWRSHAAGSTETNAATRVPEDRASLAMDMRRNRTHRRGHAREGSLRWA